MEKSMSSKKIPWVLFCFFHFQMGVTGMLLALYLSLLFPFERLFPTPWPEIRENLKLFNTVLASLYKRDQCHLGRARIFISRPNKTNPCIWFLHRSSSSRKSGSRIRLNHRLYAQRFRVHFFSVTLWVSSLITYFFVLNNLAVSISLCHWHVIISTSTSCNILDFHPYNIKTVLSVNEGIPGKVESSPFNVLSQVPQVLIICNTSILKLMWESMYILLEMPGSKKEALYTQMVIYEGSLECQQALIK